MKVLVGTKLTQKQRANDFSFVPEGEMVSRPRTCTNGTADDSCGCSRALGGVSCHQSTTTVKVIDIPGLTIKSYRNILAASERDGGWSPKPEDIEREARILSEAAAEYEVGDVLEYRDGEFAKRSV